MEDFKQKIKLLLAKNKLTAEELCKRIDMTKQNLQLIYKRNSIETKHLEKIAKELNVPISYFFENNPDLEKIISENKFEEKKENEIDKLKIEIERLNKELDFYKHAVDMKDLFISQILEANKIKEHNSSDGKAKKSA